MVEVEPKPVLTVRCYKTFWRRRWRYYLQHGDGRALTVCKGSYATMKELLRDATIVIGKNRWPIVTGEMLHETDRETTL